MSQRPAAHSLTGRSKHALGWVPWVALLLLVVIAALIWLLIANVDDQDDSSVVVRPSLLVEQLPVPAA